jgi:CDP-diacylglycerol--serine O-phosphatidyltransferase
VREFVTLSNIITSGNLAAGFFALILVVQGRLLAAAGLVVVAAVLDSLDGKLAREELDENAFGSALDSLADLVSFGAVPALALYLAGLNEVPVLGAVACLLYLLAGAWRLARFSVVKGSGVFLGLPIPPAGIAAMLLALVLPPLAALVAVLALALLMVSSIRFPTISTLRRRIGG